jgi:hypothetical protein
MGYDMSVVYDWMLQKLRTQAVGESAVIVNGNIVTGDGGNGLKDSGIAATTVLTSITAISSNTIVMGGDGVRSVKASAWQDSGGMIYPVSGAGAAIRKVTPSDTVPSLHPDSADPTSGIGRQASGNICIIASNLEVARAVVTSSVPQFLIADGAGSHPELAFRSEPTTGFHYITVKRMDWVAGGLVGFEFQGMASAVNYIQAANSKSLDPLLITALGTDTDIDISLVPKGAGKVRVGAAYAVGTTNVATGKIPVKDSTGTIYYLLCTATAG